MSFCISTNSILVPTLVSVSFNPIPYTVTEGEYEFAELILIRSGDLSRETFVTVTTADGSATGER